MTEPSHSLFPSTRVFVVGSLAMDIIVRAPRVPVSGESVLGGAYKTSPGGKGLCQAVAAARLGAGAVLVGCVGTDSHGQRIREALAREKVNASGLIVREKEPTGLSMITVGESGECASTVSPGANAALSAEDVERSKVLLERCDALLIGLESPAPAVQRAASLARELGVCTILQASPARQLSRELLSLIDVIVASQPEAARLLNMDARLDPARLALRLPELGPTTALLTMGPSGAILSHKGRPRRVSAPSMPVVDSAGCADAFCGALAAGWGPVHAAAKAKDTREFTHVERAVSLAAAAAALAGTRPGALASLPSVEEVCEASEQVRVT